MDQAKETLCARGGDIGSMLRSGGPGALAEPNSGRRSRPPGRATPVLPLHTANILKTFKTAMGVYSGKLAWMTCWRHFRLVWAPRPFGSGRPIGRIVAHAPRHRPRLPNGAARHWIHGFRGWKWRWPPPASLGWRDVLVLGGHDRRTLAPGAAARRKGNPRTWTSGVAEFGSQAIEKPESSASVRHRRGVHPREVWGASDQARWRTNRGFGS